jgi:hypothetical protein
MSLPQLRVFTFAVIRGLMPLGVAQYPETLLFGDWESGDSWLDAVRRCSIESLNTLVLPLVVLEERSHLS